MGGSAERYGGMRRMLPFCLDWPDMAYGGIMA